MMPVGLLVAGPVSDWLGITIWFLVGGVACVIMGASAFFNRAIMDLEHHTAAPAAAASTLPPVLSAD
jgi:DHA3 family macrolide efflux protein-like MFS transporter